MADVLTREQRSFNMSRITGRNTKPEMVLRRFLFSKGLRGYRVYPALFGKPDIVFPRYKLAVFVDGCFWHKCPRCFVKPATNREFWEKKIAGNMERDQLVKKRLSEEGYRVIRFWEHEIRKNINKCNLIIAREIKKRTAKKISKAKYAG